MNTISHPELHRMLNELRKTKRIFGVTFIKRTTGLERIASCRFGVTKHLRGGQERYNPADYDLVTVFDMNKRDYIKIPLDAVREITVNHVTYKIDQEEE